MSRFKLAKRDKPLIEAAVRLGDWLARQPETTEEAVEAIRWLQEALRRLPEPTFGRRVS